MIARNILGLRKQGHVLEEILNSPESSYIVNLATSIGFESVSQNELSRGIVTNYLFRKEGVE